LDNWTYRALNLPGRLTLVKEILQALPIYLFSVMATPKKILKDMRRIQRKFLWGGKDDKNKWALVNWDMVCTPKLNGGLGLRDPEPAMILWAPRYGGSGSSTSKNLGPKYGVGNMPQDGTIRI